MSYTRDHRSYPPAFIKLIETAAVREVRIPCVDLKDAKRLEGRLHAFVGVLHKAALKDPEIVALDACSRRVQIKAIGSELVAIPRDLEPDNQLILASLGTPGEKPADVPMSAEMREMFAKGLTTPQ